jgi:hypothetical protein
MQPVRQAPKRGATMLALGFNLALGALEQATYVLELGFGESLVPHSDRGPWGGSMVKSNLLSHCMAILAMVCASATRSYAADDLLSFLGSDLDDIQICGFLPGFHAHGGVDRVKLPRFDGHRDGWILS